MNKKHFKSRESIQRAEGGNLKERGHSKRPKWAKSGNTLSYTSALENREDGEGLDTALVTMQRQEFELGGSGEPLNALAVVEEEELCSHS